MSTVLTGTRLSAMARCPRQAAYHGLGHEEEGVSPEVRQYQERGQVWEAIIAARYAKKWGKENVERQRVITWPHGEGHADIYIRPEKLLVEVFSTVTPRGASVAHKIEQVKQYLYYDEEAEGAAVHVVNPAALKEEYLLPVILTDEDRERIEANAESVGAALNGGELPGRVCHKPSDAIGRFCPFASTCFEGWEPPDPLNVDGERAQVMRELYGAERAYKELDGASSNAKARRDELRERFAELHPPGDYACDTVRVRLTEVSPSPSYDIKAALACGVVTEELVQPFKKERAAYFRWSVDRLGDGPVLDAEDFGEEAPF